jgi:hypothetical protein
MKKSECVGLTPMTEQQFTTAVSDQMRFVPALAQIPAGHYTIEHTVTGSGKNQKKVVTFYNPSYTRNDGTAGRFIAVGLKEDPDALIPISALAMRAIVTADNTNVLSKGFYDNTEDLAACRTALESTKLEFDLEHLKNARWAEGRRKGTRPVVKVTP